MPSEKARAAAAAVFNEHRSGCSADVSDEPDDYRDELWISLGNLADAFDRFAAPTPEWSTTPPTEPGVYLVARLAWNGKPPWAATLHELVIRDGVLCELQGPPDNHSWPVADVKGALWFKVPPLPGDKP